MIAGFKSLFQTKNSRNRMLYNNIILSFVFKVVGLITSLLIVPVTLNYLDKEQYGIWMTLSSILMWFSYFDIGLGNGMRNYLAQAISEGDYERGRSYFSTTLIIISAIAIVLCLITTILIFVLDLNSVFNTQVLGLTQLRNALLIATICTLIVFVAKNIGLVFVALQKYAINDLLIVTGNVIALLTVFILTKTTECNFFFVVAAFTIPPVLIFLLAAIPLFRKYKALRPQIKSFDRNFAKQIVTKGLGFFFIQITSCLVIFGGSNLFITQTDGPEAVTTYNIAYKFFNLLVIGYTIILSPMWNAYTDAYVKNDLTWIRNNFYRALKTWALTFFAGIFMIVISKLFYRLWVGESIEVPYFLSACVMLYISFFNLNNCATYLVNGLNKIQIQIITSVVVTALYISTILLMGNTIKASGIVICMAVSYAIMSVIHLYQCHLIINRKASGIWNK